MDEYERKHGGNGAKVSNLLRDDLDKNQTTKQSILKMITHEQLTILKKLSVSIRKS